MQKKKTLLSFYLLATNIAISSYGDNTKKQETKTLSKQDILKLKTASELLPEFKKALQNKEKKEIICQAISQKPVIIQSLYEQHNSLKNFKENELLNWISSQNNKPVLSINTQPNSSTNDLSQTSETIVSDTTAQSETPSLTTSETLSRNPSYTAYLPSETSSISSYTQNNNYNDSSKRKYNFRKKQDIINKAADFENNLNIVSNQTLDDYAVNIYTASNQEILEKIRTMIEKLKADTTNIQNINEAIIKQSIIKSLAFMQKTMRKLSDSLESEQSLIKTAYKITNLNQLLKETTDAYQKDVIKKNIRSIMDSYTRESAINHLLSNKKKHDRNTKL